VAEQWQSGGKADPEQGQGQGDPAYGKYGAKVRNVCTEQVKNIGRAVF
jgi:hypothetical protein